MNLFTLTINDYQIRCTKTLAKSISRKIEKHLESDPFSNVFSISLQIDSNEQYKDIENIFNGNKIKVDYHNECFLHQISILLEIPMIDDLVENHELYELQEIEKAVFSIENDSQHDLFQQIFEICENVGKETVCRLLINMCLSRSKLIPKVFELLEQSEKSYEEIFCRILLGELKNLDGVLSIRANKTQIICFLVRHFYDVGRIKAKQITKLYNYLPAFFADISNNGVFLVPKDLRNDDWKQFHEMVKLGINSDPVSQILRNDEIDKLQYHYSTYKDFDINALIDPSDYEMCDFVNQKCSYMEFCAFFSAIKCFKFLFLNGAEKTPNLAEFAVAGGNVEIIHICEQMECSFAKTREIAIKYHQWEIFSWLCENIFGSFVEDETSSAENENNAFGYVQQSILFSNFSSLSYLISKDCDYNLSLPFAVDTDNILLTKWLIKHKNSLFKNKNSSSVEKSLVHFACRNENLEMVKLLLSVEKYNNVNLKYDGKTPIFIAINNRNKNIFSFLLHQKNLDLLAKDFSGKNIIHYACECKDPYFLKEIVKCFELDACSKFDINSMDKEKVYLNKIKFIILLYI